MPFNSRPHKEVDDHRHGPRRHLIKLSIHDLTRRSTKGQTKLVYWTDSFNSRPHKEVDVQRIFNHLYRLPFNSRPHKEVDFPYIKRSMREKSFQFTTSQGGRPVACRCTENHRNLSIHDLTRRSTNWRAMYKRAMRLSIHDLTRRSTTT